MSKRFKNPKWRKPKPMKHQPAPDNKDSESQKKNHNTHAYVEGGIKIEFGENLKKQHETEYEETSTHNNRLLAGTIITAVLIFIYTSVVCWQGCQTREIIENSKTQFRRENRPYVWTEPHGTIQRSDTKEIFVFMPTQDKSGYMFGATVNIANSGRSPAIDLITTNIHFRYGPTEAVREEVRKFVPDYAGHNPGILAVGVTISPAGQEFVVTNEQFAHLQDGSWELYWFGAIKYRDLFSPSIDPYETTYCMIFRPSGLPFGACNFGPGSFGNSIK